MKDMIAVGDTAPDFELKGSNGATYRLLLIFYPGNNTPG
jgi:peroxiredoxin